MAIKYLGMKAFAERVGLSKRTLEGYKLPPEDAVIEVGDRPVRGWLPETIDAWNARRPGRGARKAGRWNLPEGYQ
ncbi:XRE family transcriptional regulator [Nocardia cyriacigeorgica]|uniref:XRE family transcriptional regulator n=1 Tax=Nocardia cyriacigeorgica TaxID=135487 RepID=UPI002453F60B|nr:XRE family transcriptional regulator [Nocardia cyriacigeorgica]